PTVRSLWIRAVSPAVGVDVVYETTEQPFVLYLPTDQPPRDIEKLMVDQALALGLDYPHRKVLLYGIYDAFSSEAGGKPLPLLNAGLKAKAAVIAEYHADTDR